MSISHHVTPGERIDALRRIIANQGFAVIIEAHSGLSAIIGETARAQINGGTKEYDGLWESSLTDSATKGLPDASIVGAESRLHTIDEIIHVTTKPIIVDGDTGGETSQFEDLVIRLERLGVSAVIIEDKVFPKRNSLDASASQELEDPVTFAEKIQAGKSVTVTDDFMIIARIESLIAGTGLRDALQRAERYIEAGVDGIMIHSSRREPNELFEFARAYGPLCERLGRRPLLVSVPTTYNQHTDEELVELGFDIIIHANHLLRASHMAMKKVAQLILESGSSLQADSICSPVKEIFSEVGFDKLAASDRQRNAMLRLPVIIPAAGRDPIFPEQPKSLISVAGQPILHHQLESIRKAGLKEVVVVRGHEGAQYDAYSDEANLVLCDNPDYAQTQSVDSLMKARSFMDHGFVLVFSDLLFDHEILTQLVRTDKDIVLTIDNSYTYHRHDVDKRLDLVVSKKSFQTQFRSLSPEPVTELARIGKTIELDRADYEFIGIAFLSKQGAKILQDTYDDCVTKAGSSFQEAPSFSMAKMADLFQELIDRGFPVHGLEVSKGWREIHSREDVETAEAEMAALEHGS